MDLLVIILLLDALIFALPSAIIASKKGSSGLLWFIQGLMFGPITIFIALLMPYKPRPIGNVHHTEKPKYSPPAKMDLSVPVGMKKCPLCAELIKFEAIICRYCGSKIQEKEESQLSLAIEEVGEVAQEFKDSFKQKINATSTNEISEHTVDTSIHDDILELTDEIHDESEPLNNNKSEEVTRPALISPYKRIMEGIIAKNRTSLVISSLIICVLAAYFVGQISELHYKKENAVSNDIKLIQKLRSENLSLSKTNEDLQEKDQARTQAVNNRRTSGTNESSTQAAALSPTNPSTQESPPLTTSPPTQAGSDLIQISRAQTFRFAGYQILVKKVENKNSYVVYAIQNGREIYSTKIDSIESLSATVPVIKQGVPSPDCQSMLMDLGAEGSADCGTALLFSDCSGTGSATEISVCGFGRGPSFVDVANNIVGIKVNDYDDFYAYSVNDQHASLCGAESPSMGRLLVFQGQRWRVDKPGEFPGYYKKIEAKDAAIFKGWMDPQSSAAHAIEAAYYSYMMTGNDSEGLSLLKQTLPLSWRSYSNKIWSDIRKAATSFNPVKQITDLPTAATKDTTKSFASANSSLSSPAPPAEAGKNVPALELVYSARWADYSVARGDIEKNVELFESSGCFKVELHSAYQGKARANMIKDVEKMLCTGEMVASRERGNPDRLRDIVTEASFDMHKKTVTFSGAQAYLDMDGKTIGTGKIQQTFDLSSPKYTTLGRVANSIQALLQAGMRAEAKPESKGKLSTTPSPPLHPGDFSAGQAPSSEQKSEPSDKEGNEKTQQGTTGTEIPSHRKVWYIQTAGQASCHESSGPAARIEELRDNGLDPRSQDFTDSSGEITKVEVSYSKDPYGFTDSYRTYYREKAECEKDAYKELHFEDKYK